MAIPTLVLVLAVLLAVVSLAEPLAQRLRLPSSVILAVIGIVIGTAAAVVGRSPNLPLGEAAAAIGSLPINSQVFLFIFLPALLFQGALEADVRDLANDAVPILTMAILAVVAATFGIGLVLSQFSGVPLLACLLVGAIVATTDPSAVIAIFRDLGVPERLGRLVEGESLLNDAVAITLFVIFLDLLTGDYRASAATIALRVAIVPLGGALIGYALARLFVAAFAISRDNRLVQVSLTVALPYTAFVLAEHWHLSGPIAVASAGLTMSGLGPSRISPSSWRYLQEVWGQLAFWASSLIFVLAAILVPRLISGISADEALLLAALTVTALVTRAAVLFGLLPVLAGLRLSPDISAAFRAVMLWGGLRGAVTLALALAVTENAGLPEPVKRFVAVLATGFVLFTLLIQGTTLRPLMRRLGLDRLTALDAALRGQAVAWSQAEVRTAVAETAERYALSPQIAESVAAEYEAASPDEAEQAPAGIADKDKVAVGLVALAAREQDLLLQHLENGTASQRLVSALRPRARRLLDVARSEGADGYRREAAAMLAFTRRIRWANMLHARFGISRSLERELSRRFEMLIVQRIILNGLLDFAANQLAGLLGDAVCRVATDAVVERREGTERALDALRLQYPDYAEQRERWFLRMSALRVEQRGYERLSEEGLIGPEIRRTLLQEVAARTAADSRSRLDLRLNTPDLIRRVPMLAGLAQGEADALARLMSPAFAIPGQRLVTKGERGDSAYFIASGAVEVATSDGPVRLGRGDFFGELALLTGLPRQADVTAIAFSQLLVLTARDFRRFLDGRPDIRAQVQAVAAERLGPGHDAFASLYEPT